MGTLVTLPSSLYLLLGAPSPPMPGRQCIGPVSAAGKGATRADLLRSSSSLFCASARAPGRICQDLGSRVQVSGSRTSVRVIYSQSGIMASKASVSSVSSDARGQTPTSELTPGFTVLQRPFPCATQHEAEQKEVLYLWVWGKWVLWTDCW